MATTKTVRDVMTYTVATCAPDASLVEAAKLMSDLNIGDIVVTQDNKIKGIVTDRDITVRAVADGDDVRVAPVKKYMTDVVVTGRTDWSLDKVAETMSKHQVRRLPIVENDQLVGIVSLGDVALHERDKKTIATSLREISEPEGLHATNGVGARNVGVGMLLATLVGAAVSFLFISESGKQLRETVKHEIDERDWGDTALQLLEEARDRLDQIADALDDAEPPSRNRLSRLFS